MFDPAIVGENNNTTISYTYETAIEYTREIIPFDPPEFSDTTFISLIYNDDVDTLSLPFNFVFFGNSYDVIYPASNGYISFGAPHDTWYITIPDPGGINNLLALAGYDLNPSVGGSIYYSVSGTTPYRQLQLRYEDVPVTAGPTHTIDVTTILYESTNIIDIYVDKLPEVGGFGFVQGISNEDGSQYYYTKILGTPVWFIGANDTAFRFIPTLCPRTIFDTIHVVGDISENVLGNDSLFCFGDSIMLAPDTTSSYFLWNTGDTTQIITVNEEGYYSIEMEYIPGCKLFDTIFVEEIDSIVLSVSSTPTDTDINTGSASVDIVSGGLPPFTYLWSTGDTTSIIENLSSGIYGITVIDSFGCSVHASVIVDEKVSINNTGFNDFIQIFPNPAEDYFIVELNDQTNDVILELMTLEGEIIHSEIINSTSQISTSDFARGVYFIIFKMQDGIYISKLILN
jgi:hypothetical protein